MSPSLIELVARQTSLHLVPSIRWILATIMAILLHKPWSSTASSAPPGPSLTSYFLPPSLPRTTSLPSSHAKIIFCSRPLDHITWPKNIFCFPALCLSDMSPLARVISISINSFVLFSVQETLSILLQIHISQTSIFFSSTLGFD